MLPHAHSVGDSTDAPLGPRFVRLAIANILANLLVPLAGVIDTAFLGHLSDIRHLAGVALATVLFNYLYWSFGFLRMATTGLTAQAVGQSAQQRAGDSPEARDAAADALVLILLRHGAIALGAGLGIVLLQGPIRQIGFSLLSGQSGVQAAGLAFYHSRIWDAPATLLNFVLLGWWLGQGQGRRVLLLSAVANGANILLDYLCVVRLGWASAGAGAATALSQYVVLGVGLALVQQQVPGSRVRRLGGQVLDWGVLRAMGRLNRDLVIRTFVLISAFGSFTNLSAGLGTQILAANSVLLQVVTLASYGIDGFAFATETLAGQVRGTGGTVVGQRAVGRLRRLLAIAVGVSVLTGLGVAIAVGVMPGVLGLLTDHREVLALAQGWRGWLVPVLGLGAIAFALDGYFLGLTQGQVLRDSTVVAVLVGFAPLAGLAWYWRNPVLLWGALTLLMLGRSLTLALQVPASLRVDSE